MLRILFFLALVLALGFGFAWVADRPGEIVLNWQGQQYQTSLMVLLAALAVLVATIMIIWWIINTILNSPRIMARFMRRRKKERGYDALSKGLIAAGAGDAATARRFSKESNKLLADEPLVGLLDAQTLLLEGNRDKARQRFEDMLGDDNTRLVALRGLYLEAEKQGAREAARHYVEEAAKLAPSVAWAGNATLRYRATEGDWDGALKALESNKVAGLISKDDAKRQRAVLLTARAISSEQADPALSAKLAKEALKLAPDLVPAAVIGAKALMRNNDLRRSASMLESAWKKEAHPEIADAYIHLRLGDSALDRLKRAKKMSALRPNNPEGNMAVAEAAIEAQEWETAREAMRSVINLRPTERACLIMADIEEGEFGDKGRMRDWLSRAVRAPKDAAWTAEGYVSEKWLPFSPVSGKIDAFEWKVPVEQLDGPAALDSDDLENLMAPAAAGSAAVGAGVAITEAIDDAVEADDDKLDSVDEELGEEDYDKIEETASNHEKNTKGNTIEADVVEDDKNQSEPAEKEDNDMDDELVGAVKAPDDPGIADDAKPADKKRFGFF